MAVTRDSLIEEIRAAIDQNAYDKMQHSLGYWGNNSGALGAAAKNSAEKINQLKSLLLNMGGSESESWANPFGAGGNAPALATDNRFAAGLTDAESRLRSLLDNPDSIQQSGAYKFRVKQGEDALQRQMGARGMLNSGNRLMELTKYGQDMASQEYDAQYGRLGNLLGNYTGGYTADRNSNINQFAAQSNAWNTAQANADRNRYQMGMLSIEQGKPGQVISRSSGGSDMSQLYAPQKQQDPFQTDSWKNFERDRGWVYEYTDGGRDQSLWKNTATGESTWSPGGREGNPSYRR